MFNKGDKIKRIAECNDSVVKTGNIYTVTEANTSYVKVEGSVLTWEPSYFELVTKTTLTKFEVGKWYIHPKKEHNSNWTSVMDSVLDGKPHKCTASSGYRYAKFDCTIESWTWDLSEFEEVTQPIIQPKTTKKVTNFEVGKIYRFTKSKLTSNTTWDDKHKMDSVLDGLPHRCIRSNGLTAAVFDCTPECDIGQNGMWYWSLSDFEEVDDLSYIQHEDNCMEVIKMEPAETKFEKAALKEAKKQQIEAETNRKADEFKCAIQTWISLERNARSYTNQANELAAKLELTQAEKDELL